MLKKLIVVTVGLALSVPALADPGHRGYGYYARPRVVVHERYVVERPVLVQRPVVVERYYRPAPRPVYVVPAHDAVPLLFGALVGAVVVHSVLTR